MNFSFKIDQCLSYFLTFLVEKHFGSGRNVGLGSDEGIEGAGDEVERLHFLGVSSHIAELLSAFGLFLHQSETFKTAKILFDTFS